MVLSAQKTRVHSHGVEEKRLISKNQNMKHALRQNTYFVEGNHLAKYKKNSHRH